MWNVKLICLKYLHPYLKTEITHPDKQSEKIKFLFGLPIFNLVHVFSEFNLTLIVNFV